MNSVFEFYNCGVQVFLATSNNMAAFFERVADQGTKDLVNGYIKQYQSLLPHEENSYYTIPALVIHLILSFYYNPEYFTAHGSFTTLNKECDIFEYNAKEEIYHNSNSVYGNIEIVQQMYCNKFLWEFEIISIEEIICVAIGLDSSDKEYPNGLFDSITNPNTFYSYESSRIRSQIRANHGSKSDYGCCYCMPKNTVSMELNTKQKTLRYFVNGKDQGIAIHDVIFDNNQRYVAAISTDNDVKIKLVRFEQTHE